MTAPNENAETIERLEKFKALLKKWKKDYDDGVRTKINQEKNWVRQQVIEAGCFKTVTIAPPPAIGGLVMRNIDMFNSLFDPPYGSDFFAPVTDMVDETIGILNAPPKPKPVAKPLLEITEGFVFVAMPIDESNPQLIDVLDAIKEAADRCGLVAERVDEAGTNDRITDSILRSLEKAEFVVVDLTDSRPNVYYEAGYAHALKKVPIFIARKGTRLEFDVKDFPVIFFDHMKGLKEKLEERFRSLAAKSNGGKKS